MLSEFGETLPFFRRALVLGHRKTHGLRKVTDRVHEAHAKVLHQEADGVAMHTAAEAVVGLARGTDGEAGGFFAVKGTQTHVVCTRLPQRDVSTDNLGNVDTAQQVLNE